MICPKCHTVNNDKEKFCKNCGFQLNPSRICPRCGKTNDPNSKYCKECGTVLTPVNTFRKQVIEENTKKSFFSIYKIPIICALIIILVIGAVTGMAYYNGNSSGDDGFNSIIPTDNNTGFFNDDINNNPTDAQIQDDSANKTNQTNKTNDTNKTKTLREKIDNKTNGTNKNINSTVNKIKEQNNKSKSLNGSSTKNNSSKVNKTSSISDKTDKNNKINQTNKNSLDNHKNKSESSILVSNISINDSDNDKTNDSTDDLLNDSTDNSVNDSNIGNDDLNDSDNDNENLSSSSSLNEIKMTDVPNLAKKVSEKNYDFSTIEYEGNEFTEAQCIYIFSEYLLNVNKDKSSPIKIKDIKKASNPSGKDLNQSIDKSDYLSIANRVHSWINSKGSVPNYVGISELGADDLSPKKMLKLFALATLEYSVTEELPESVEI